MKILILALCISLFSTLGSQLYSQGNLQFNQVLSYTGTLSCSTINCGQLSATTYTVPAGKVWKIENVGYNSSSVAGYYSFPYLTVNGVVCYGGNNNTALMSGNLINSPIWLKAGDILKYGMNSNYPFAGQTMSISLHLSIIEFNIIP